MRRPRNGFTLVELLVVIGVIAVLIGILLPALGKARRAAQQVRSTSGMRQLLTGHLAYQQEHRGALPWGYPPATVDGGPITVELPGVATPVGGITAQRYPWRLVRYVSDLWPILHAHGDVPADDYLKGLAPTFGINSVFVGGHDSPFYRGFVGDRPNVGKHVVFKASQVRRASELIVFADARPDPAGPFAALGGGAHYVCPPNADGPRWRTAANGRDVQVFTGVFAGYPIGRYGQGAVTGFFDGHVESLRPRQLENMRLWANFADGPDYDY